MTIRLVALDLDGTALDARGRLTRSVRDAVRRVRNRDIGVVLCTGRRFRTTLPIARELELTGPVVVNNGVLVKDLESGETLRDELLDPAFYDELLAFARNHSPPLIYVDAYHDGTDFLTERVEAGHPFQQEYLADNAEFCRVVPDLADSRPGGVIMMSIMGDSLGAMLEGAREAFGDRVRTQTLQNKAYRGEILEFLSPRSGKWRALLGLAREQGVEAQEIAAIGDDHNDVEMIAGAGLGIAMGNAVEPARRAARLVVRSNAEGGASEALERVLLSGSS